MTPDSPKGPETLRERVLHALCDGYNEQHASSTKDAARPDEFVGEADAVMAVVEPELTQITFERDAADQAAYLLTQQLEDLRDDVLGDESLLVPEIVGAAARTVERLTAEVTQLRADMRIRQGALNDVLGHDRSQDTPTDYYRAVEDVAELKRDHGRLTAEVERLRMSEANVRAALRVSDEGLIQFRALSVRQHRDCLRELLRGMARRSSERRRMAFDLVKYLDQKDAEVSRLREQLAAQQLPPNASYRITAKVMIRLMQAGAPLTLAQRNFLPQIVMDEMKSWGVSSSEVEAPQPRHIVTIEPREGVFYAECSVCHDGTHSRDQAVVEYWAEQHDADTLRPEVAKEWDLLRQLMGVQSPSVSSQVEKEGETDGN